jgi:hypothetical protein
LDFSPNAFRPHAAHPDKQHPFAGEASGNNGKSRSHDKLDLIAGKARAILLTYKSDF